MPASSDHDVIIPQRFAINDGLSCHGAECGQSLALMAVVSAVLSGYPLGIWREDSARY